MENIIFMMILGLTAGMLSCFWTRIIRTDMIFRKFGKYLTILNNRHIIEHNSDSMLVKFIRCCFCIQVWLSLLFCTWYIIDSTPDVIPSIIGVLGALGAGNFVCEIVHGIRMEE